MKLTSLLLLAFLFTPVKWFSNIEDAKKQAVIEHKLILINFSGSDWCGPCIRLKTEILASSQFDQYAQEHLVLVNADFPRQKKNKLSKEQTKLNEDLAEKYNLEGKFPYTVLINEAGKVIRSWDGFPNESAEKFVEQIKASSFESK